MVKKSWVRQKCGLKHSLCLSFCLSVDGDDVSTLFMWLLQERHVKMLQRLYTESGHKYSSLSLLQAVISVLETQRQSDPLFISAKSSLVSASMWPHFFDASFRCCVRCFCPSIPVPTCLVHRISVLLQMLTIVAPLPSLGTCLNSCRHLVMVRADSW